MSLTLKMPSLAPSAPIAPEPVAPEPTLGSGTPFRDVLSSAIDEVEGARASADQSVQQFLSGEGDDLHATILASQRADLEFQMFLSVRNKVVSAYQEIMKMQV